MSLNVKLPAQSFEALFKTAQISPYSGNHIGGIYIVHNFTVLHNGLTFLPT